jgi:RNA polymerase primary sigma factor
MSNSGSPAIAASRPATVRLSALLDLLMRAALALRVAAPVRDRHALDAQHAPPALDTDDDTDADTAAPPQAEVAHVRSYLREVRALPRLSAAREVELFALAGAHDTSALQREAARREIISANLWMVPVVVSRFYRHGSGFEDLVAEGNMGLYKAFDRFDPARGFRFSTYAKWWVVDAVTAAMAANAYPVRVPRKVAQSMARQNKDDGGSRHESSNATGPAPDADDAALPMSTQALDLSAAAVEDDAHEDPQPLPEQVVALRQTLRLLASAVTELPPRERRVIEGRYGLNGQREQTLQEIGDELGVTAERVRTLQLSAMAMLKQHFDARGAAH